MSPPRSDDGELTVRGRKPFAMIPTDLVRDPAIGSSAIRLWTVLASYAYGSDVVTRPSRVALAKVCGYGSTRAVDLNLRQLERVGWLTIEPTRRADGGRGNNRYILEWEPRASVPSPNAENRDTAVERPPVPRDHVCAGQAPAKIIASGFRPAARQDIDAGQGPAKNFAPGADGGDPPAKNSSLGPAKINAHHRERTQTQEKPPPAAVGDDAACSQRAHFEDRVSIPEPLAAIPTISPTDLAAAVKSALPRSLAHQLGTRVLRDRCALLVEAGWTREQVESATKSRSWTGAGGGAVVRWITDLATERPPTAADCDRRTTVERQLATRRERRMAIDAAAGSSDLRQQAVRVAAQLAATSRSRRRMQLGRPSGPDVTPGADVQAGRDQQHMDALGYGDSPAALAANGSFDSSISSRTNRSQTISELRAGAEQ